MAAMYKISKEEGRRYTNKQLFQIGVLVGIAFFSVAIQIFLYLKKNRKELVIYHILGISQMGSYGILFFQYICNMVVAFFVLYLLYDSTGILVMEGLQWWHQSMQWENWAITFGFFAIYMLVTGIVYAIFSQKQ